MAKKSKYEPHPRLGTKVVPSGKDYDRDTNRKALEDELASMIDVPPALPEDGDLSTLPILDFDEYFLNVEGEQESAQEMYEHGFHIEIPEN